MMRRSPRVVFSPGASVFPGGAVDDADREVAAAGLVRGADDAIASRELSLAHGGLGFTVAAARECFEEAGLLLARDRASGAPVDLDDSRRRDRLAELRRALNAGRLAWVAVLQREDVVIDARDVRVLAHWLTPLEAPRRYDTWFFVAPAPVGDDGIHDDSELVASEWMAPADALDRNTRGEIDLILPTKRVLTVASRYVTANEFLAATRAVARDERGQPEIVADCGGERLRLPGDDEGSFGWTVPLPDRTRTALRREGVA
jgi:8-oxo-dGTP pyrophosphatase MutT (NUDIX family)